MRIRFLTGLVLFCAPLTVSGMGLGSQKTIEKFSSRVVLVGDSLSVDPSGFANQLDLVLRKEGRTVRTVAGCGASPRTFYHGGKTHCGFLSRLEDGTEQTALQSDIPAIETFLELSDSQGKKAMANLVVIQLGTNLYDDLLAAKSSSELQAARESITQEAVILMSDIVAVASSAKLLWVAPPKILKYSGIAVSKDAQDAMFSALAEAVNEMKQKSKANAEILDSRLYTENPAGSDGTHFTSSQTNPKWIEAARKKLKTMLP